MQRPAYLPFALMVEYAGDVYHFATLSANLRTQEFFYGFITAEKNFRNTASLGDDSFVVGSLEHISFHCDGTIHVKMRGYQSHKKHYWKTHKLLKGIVDFVVEKKLVPVLIDSVFAIDDPSRHLPAVECDQKRGVTSALDSDQNYSGYIWSLERRMDFSAILLLVHESLDFDSWRTHAILQRVAYTYADQEPVCIELFSGVYAMVVLSQLTARPPSGVLAEDQYRGFVVGPTWEAIATMRYRSAFVDDEDKCQKKTGERT